MTGQIASRLQLALAGAIGGLLLWLVNEAMELSWLSDAAAIVLLGLVLTLSGGLLAMAGPIGLWRALPRALGLAVLTAGLVALALLRYDEPSDFFDMPMNALAGLAVAVLPIPFLIAAAKSGWRDYPVLFMEAWSIILRFAAAGAFTGLIWLVIYLSDQVLRIVGVEVIGDLIEHGFVPPVVTGAVMGLAMAVIFDLAELLSPYLVLRMFRLLLPVVLGVMAVFLIALLVRGLNGLVSGFSPAMLLLAMVAAGIALVSIAVDQTDAEATPSPVQLRSTQGMALILPVFAGLALWAIWLRVGQHGWTPERLFILLIGAVGLGYGLVYAAAVLRGTGWMERIRQGNIRMALGVIGLAALWLTPVLNAERISAEDHLARLEDGRLAVESLDVYALKGWGRPGLAVLATLEAKAKEPGQEALAAVLSGETVPAGPAQAELAAALGARMPVQPATAAGTRDMILGLAEVYMLQDWTAVCERKLETGRPACLMVVADLMPALPGEEAVVFLGRSPDYVEVLGVSLDAGVLRTRSVLRPDGSDLDTAEAAALLRQYQETPPPTTRAMLNQLGTGETGLIILP
jgi:Domain of unknown function (DUF4153)